jgi:hypothetical protein
MTNHKEKADAFLEMAVSKKFERSPAGSAAAALAISMGQVHATLALVEQQRIANMIALENQRIRKTKNQGHYYGSDLLYDEPSTLYGNWELRPEIAAALGIEQKS